MLEHGRWTVCLHDESPHRGPDPSNLTENSVVFSRLTVSDKWGGAFTCGGGGNLDFSFFNFSHCVANGRAASIGLYNEATNYTFKHAVVSNCSDTYAAFCRADRVKFRAFSFHANPGVLLDGGTF
jgi:hypothetical protein